MTVADKPPVITTPVNPKPEPVKPVDETIKPIEPTKTTSPVKVEMVDEELYPTHQWLGLFVAGLAVMLLLMVWRLSLRVQDTQVFISVMQEWKDFLSKHHDTPRDWKRLMNRARLFAMRVRVNQRQAWYESFDKKWRGFRFESSSTPVIEPPVLDESLAMHLMMLDIYSKGNLNLVSLLSSLFDLDNDALHNRYIWNIGNQPAPDGCTIFPEMNGFFDKLAPSNKETPEGKQARAQLSLWLSLYAGLNSTKQIVQQAVT